MLRNIFRYFCGLTLALIVGAGFAGCSDDNNGLELPQEQLPESGYITLSLKCVEGTRAPEDDDPQSPYTENGVDGLNENWIETVTICLWAKGGDQSDDTAKPDYVQTFIEVNKRNAASFRIPLTVALKNKLFETSGATCHAFAAVNVTPPTGEFTIADLRNLTVESTFSSQRTQAFFTMDDDCVVSYDPARNLATGNLDLQRSASKITLALDVDDIVEQTAIVDGALVTSKWMPDTETMRVWLKGGLAESTLDPKLDATPSEAYFFDTPDNLTYTFVANEAGENNTPDNGNNPPNNGETTRTYPFIQEVPFYTYPHRWTTEPDDYAATYMILSIPWMQVEWDEDKNKYEQIPGTTWRTCYYQVPVIPEDSDPLQLVRNVSYHVYLHVGLLGSFEPDVPLELDELEYSAAEWGNVDIDVKIPDVRYLVVDQNDYTVNNETSITIPFYTSHETVVTDATMTFYRYNFSDAGLEKTVTVTMEQNLRSATLLGDSVFYANFNNSTKQLLVKHDLKVYEALDSSGTLVSFTNGDGPSVSAENRRPNTESQWQSKVIDNISYYRKKIPEEDEYSRIEFKITLQHKDIHEASGTPSHNFEEVITINQYPGIYIETAQNYCGNANTVTYNFTGAQGNAFINGYYTNRDGDNRPSKGIALGWTSSIGLNSEYNNFNPNMYLVTVTTLPEGTEYKIGDPRSLNINNNLESSEHNTFDPTSELGRSPTASNFYGTAYTVARQEGYVRALITRGVNSPLSSVQDLTPWVGTNYSWYYWTKPKNGGNASFYIEESNSGSVDVTGFRTQTAIEGSRRTIRYYYPTLEDDDHKMMIAPKFRICSSYAGTTWILNRELARRRAASYQEIGYAAGRWRLPTYGEVKFIMELAATYKIPRLFGTFNTTWWYWCAQGLVCVPSKQSGKSGVSLPNESDYELPIVYGARDCQRARFVYDEWYWGEADLKANGTIGSTTPVYTFTWGDKEF